MNTKKHFISIIAALTAIFLLTGCGKKEFSSSIVDSATPASSSIANETSPASSSLQQPDTLDVLFSRDDFDVFEDGKKVAGLDEQGDESSFSIIFTHAAKMHGLDPQAISTKRGITLGTHAVNVISALPLRECHVWPADIDITLLESLSEYRYANLFDFIQKNADLTDYEISYVVDFEEGEALEKNSLHIKDLTASTMASMRIVIKDNLVENIFISVSKSNHTL